MIDFILKCFLTLDKDNLSLMVHIYDRNIEDFIWIQRNVFLLIYNLFLYSQGHLESTP